MRRKRPTLCSCRGASDTSAAYFRVGILDPPLTSRRSSKITQGVEILIDYPGPPPGRGFRQNRCDPESVGHDQQKELTYDRARDFDELVQEEKTAFICLKGGRNATRKHHPSYPQTQSRCLAVPLVREEP